MNKSAKTTLIAVALFAAALASCKKDKDHDPAAPDAATITTITAAAPDGDDGSDLKIAITGSPAKTALNWKAGDKIYIFKVSGTNFDATFGKSEFTLATGAGTKTATFTLTAGTALTDGQQYVAAHVGRAAAIALVSGKIEYTPLTAITQAADDNFAAADDELLFIAQPTTVTAAAAAFAFAHTMSLIEFQISREAAVAAFSANGVSIAASAGTPFAAKATYSVSGATLTAAYTGVATLAATMQSAFAVGTTAAKMRLPVMWNTAFNAASGANYSIALNKPAGSPEIFLKPANKALLPGYIYNMPMTVAAAPPAKTVTVGAQSGTMTQGVPYETVSFPISTSGIASGTYTVTLNGAPAGIDLFQVNTVSINSAGNGTLELEGNSTGSTPAGNHSMSVSIDGVTSNTFVLTIGGSASKTVTVSAQVGTMTTGVANSSADFPLTTSGIANGQYTATLSGAPATVSVSQGMVNISGNSGTLTLVGNASTTTGIHTVTVTIDGVTSNKFRLTIMPVVTFSGAGT